MTVGFVRRDIPLMGEDGLMRREWYNYFEQMHQNSGQAGGLFPLWEKVSVGVVHPAFDDSADESSEFAVYLPMTYVPGTNLVPYIRWSPNGASTGVVVWLFTYQMVQPGSSPESPVTLDMRDTGDGTALKHQVIDGDEIAARTLKLAAGTAIGIDITRDADNAEDTLVGDANLIDAGFFYMRGGVGVVQR